MKHYGLEALAEESELVNRLYAIIEQIRSEKGGAYQ